MHSLSLKSARKRGDFVELTLRDRRGSRRTVQFPCDLKEGQSELEPELRQAMVERNFQVKGPTSYIFRFGGGIGDILIGLETAIAFQKTVREMGRFSHEMLAHFIFSNDAFYKRFFEALDFFHGITFKQDSERIRTRYRPQIMECTPWVPRPQHVAIGSAWDVYWARWGLPGRFPWGRVDQDASRLKKKLKCDPARELKGLVGRDDRVLLLFPDSVSMSESKSWPLRNWEKLVSQVLDHSSLRILVLSSQEAFKKLAKNQPRVQIVNYADPALGLDLYRLSALLQFSKGAITTQSGPSFIAGFLKVPCITLFGPTHPGYVGHPNNLNLRSSICSPCHDDARSFLCPENVCMKELAAGSVSKLALKMVNGDYVPR